jgi:hypothetical protein
MTRARKLVLKPKTLFANLDVTEAFHHQLDPGAHLFHPSSTGCACKRRLSLQRESKYSFAWC